MRRRHEPPSPWIERRTVALGLVFAGGGLGTAAREGLALAFPPDDIPYAIWAINVGGSLILGFLLGILATGSSGLHRGLRLAVGTGFCGGFTTYSSLAVAGADLMGDGLAGSSLLYALGTLLLGGLAAWAGLALGAALVIRNAAARKAVTSQEAWVDPDVDEVPGGSAVAEAEAVAADEAAAGRGAVQAEATP